MCAIRAIWSADKQMRQLQSPLHQHSHRRLVVKANADMTNLVASLAMSKLSELSLNE